MSEPDSDATAGPIAMLLFRKGFRPDPAALLQWLAAAEVLHLITAPAIAPPGQAEILREGLTFELTGLSPAVAQAHLPVRHSYGLPEDFPGQPLEAIHLRPGPHLCVGGLLLLPVVRVAAGLLADLAELPGLVAISWTAAENVVCPQSFARSIRAWQQGGAYPAFSLVSLSHCRDGTVLSEGLRGLVGRELRLTPRLGQEGDVALKQAVRLVDWLVMQGPAHAYMSRLPGVGKVQFELTSYGELHAAIQPD